MANTFDGKNERQAFIENVFRDIDEPYQVVLERTWFRNLLYFLGEQWLAWLGNSNTFGSMYNAGVPTPVSNIIRDYARSMQALVLNKQYTATVWPNSDEREDKDAAEVGNVRSVEPLPTWTAMALSLILLARLSRRQM
jgi:hypothetical protein